MGLLSTTHVSKVVDNSVHYPDTINVHEHKAPTDASIKLLAEMQQKTLDSIIAKISVEDNIVSGEVVVLQKGVATQLDYHKVIVKFKINGEEFVIEAEIRDRDLEDPKSGFKFTNQVQEMGKQIIIWYCLKMFAPVAYKQLTGEDMPKFVLSAHLKTL